MRVTKLSNLSSENYEFSGGWGKIIHLKEGPLMLPYGSTCQSCVRTQISKKNNQLKKEDVPACLKSIQEKFLCKQLSYGVKSPNP